MKKLTLLIFITFYCVSQLYAQQESISISSDTVIWKVTSFYNSTNQETISGTGKFILNSGQSIEWIQDAGDTKYDFIVVNTAGNWSDLTQDGSLTFKVERRGRLGDITFTRSNGKTTIQLEFMRDNKNTMPFTFVVSNIEKR